MVASPHRGLLCLVLWATSMPAVGTATAPPVVDATRAFLEGLQGPGKWSDLETRAVIVGIERAPELLPAAVSGLFGDASAPPGASLPLSATQKAALGANLLFRVKLQAIAEGRVELDEDQDRRLAPLLASRASPDLEQVDLAMAIDRLATTSLALDQKVARPSCPSGTTTRYVGGQKACIEADPWTRALFNAVVPVAIAGRGSCSGTALSPDTILTAAHCVLEDGAAGVGVIAADRISVKLPSGQSRAVVSLPQVPAQMLHDCLPICPDMDFDFAVLKILAAPGAELLPLPSFRGLPASGAASITMAGYGISTMPASASGDGLFIGSQALSMHSVEQALQWKFAMADGAGSTFCQGDSGGPIFLGRPRRAGDSLELIGVVSRFVGSDGLDSCLSSHASAVNLSRPGPREAFCRMVGNSQPGC